MVVRKLSFFFTFPKERKERRKKQNKEEKKERKEEKKARKQTMQTWLEAPAVVHTLFTVTHSPKHLSLPAYFPLMHNSTGPTVGFVVG